MTTSPPALQPSGMPAKRFWIIWGLGFRLWVCTLAAASPFDLPLSIAIADPHLPFARSVATYGELPGWVVVFWALMILIARPKPESRVYPMKTASLGLIIQVLLHPLLITQSIKFFWGRVRFVSLAPRLLQLHAFLYPCRPLYQRIASLGACGYGICTDASYFLLCPYERPEDDPARNAGRFRVWPGNRLRSNPGGSPLLDRLYFFDGQLVVGGSGGDAFSAQSQHFTETT